MATYEEIYGKRVKEFDSDPTLDSSYEGQVWYDKSTGVLKSVVSFSAFSSAASMSNPRSQAIGGIGTKDAAIAAGLSASDGTSEEYNGTGWSSGGTLNNPASLGTGCGTLTAGSRFGGIQPTPAGKDSNYHENYDGTSWTAATGMPFDSYQNACGGTQTANIVVQSFFNPTPSSGGFPTATAEWDGSSWTAGGAISTARREAFSSKGGGTQTSTFLAGGNSPGGIKNSSETYDGTSWTSTPNINTARMRGGGGGTATAGIIVAGTTSDPQPPGLTTATESWDGSSWTTNPFSTGVAIYSQGSAFATSTSGVTFGGTDSTGTVATTEELTTSINAITAAAWSSGDNLPTVVYRNTGFGTQTAGVSAGGSSNPPGAQPSTTNVFKYDGSSWTSTGALGTARRGLMSAGTQTAGLVFAGSGGSSDSNVNNESEEFNGSTFSEGNNCNTSVSLAGGSGTQTSAVKAGGYTGSGNSSSSEEYDGTSWTSGNSINTARRSISQVGEIPNAKLIGGEASGGSQNTNVEDYDGTNWTNGTALITADKGGAAAAGTPSACIVAFGRNPSTVVATTQGWDGTSWSTRPSGATARVMVGGNGTSTAAFIAGGEGPPLFANTENFDGETSAVAAKTLTTS